MILFDSKGDFHEKFYRPDDVVISNDSDMPGVAGYWNIFNEIDFSTEAKLKESIYEIAETLFYEKIHGSKEPFFPNAAKDLLAAVLLHFSRVNYLSRDNAGLKQYLDGSPVDLLREMLGCYDDLRAMETYIAAGSNQANGVFAELQQLSRKTFIGSFSQAGSLSIRRLAICCVLLLSKYQLPLITVKSRSAGRW